MQEARIFITGSSGFIGTNLSQLLIEKGYENLFLIDTRNPKILSHCRFHTKCDINNYLHLEQLVKQARPTHVVHLAANTAIRNSPDLSAYRTNIVGTYNLSTALKLYSPEAKIIYSSSMLAGSISQVSGPDQINGLPTTDYGLSKLIGERILISSGLEDFLILRLTSIWGEWQGEPFYNLFRLLSSGFMLFPVVPGNKTLRYVRDAAEDIVELLFQLGGLKDRCLYIGDTEPISVMEWAEGIAAQIGKPLMALKIPKNIMTCLGLIGDILKIIRIRMPITSNRIANISRNIIIDRSLLYISDRVATPTKIGISNTLQWMHNKR